jgi:hypothetical protein
MCDFFEEEWAEYLRWREAAVVRVTRARSPRSDAAAAVELERTSPPVVVET